MNQFEITSRSHEARNCKIVVSGENIKEDVVNHRSEFRLDYYFNKNKYYKSIKGFNSFMDFKKKMYEHVHGSSELLRKNNINKNGIYVTLHSVFTYMDEEDLKDIERGEGRQAKFLEQKISGPTARAIARAELVRRNS